jgi:hypothetical protein
VCVESEESLALVCLGKINYFSSTHERKAKEGKGMSGIRKFYRFPNSIYEPREQK